MLNEARRILVAQSDPATRELASMRLSLSGYAVSQAGAGREAVDAIQLLRPHALVLDMELSGFSGYEILQWMNRSGAIQRTAVLILTRRLVLEEAKIVVRLGAKDYMSRPFNDAAFLQRVRRMLAPKVESASADHSAELLI